MTQACYDYYFVCVCECLRFSVTEMIFNMNLAHNAFDATRMCISAGKYLFSWIQSKESI